MATLWDAGGCDAVLLSILWELLGAAEFEKEPSPEGAKSERVCVARTKVGAQEMIMNLRS